jgi:small-conductance mechanosensitive channel
MPNDALLVSTVAMGLLLVGAALGVARLQKRPDYTPRFHPARRGELVEGGVASQIRSNAVLLGTAALLVALVAGFMLGDGTIALLIVTPLLIAAYLTWGVYNIARVRGLPLAHSIGLSAWVFAVVLVGVVAVKLLFG